MLTESQATFNTLELYSRAFSYVRLASPPPNIKHLRGVALRIVRNEGQTVKHKAGGDVGNNGLTRDSRPKESELIIVSKVVSVNSDPPWLRWFGCSLNLAML